jgi:hypothetical protein
VGGQVGTARSYRVGETGVASSITGWPRTMVSECGSPFSGLGFNEAPVCPRCELIQGFVFRRTTFIVGNSSEAKYHVGEGVILYRLFYRTIAPY